MPGQYRTPGCSQILHPCQGYSSAHPHQHCTVELWPVPHWPHSAVPWGYQPDLVPHRQYTPRGHRLTPHWLVPHPDPRCPGLAHISALPAGGRGSGPARLGFCIWNAFCGTTLNFFDILSAFLPLKKSGKENSAEKGFKGEKGCKACGRSRRQEYQNTAMLRAACFAEGKDEFRLSTAQYKTFMQLYF